MKTFLKLNTTRVLSCSPGLQRETVRRQAGAEAQGLHASIVARHLFLQQGSAQVPLIPSEEENAVTAEGDDEVRPGGAAVHPGEAGAPTGHAGGHADAEPRES